MIGGHDVNGEPLYIAKAHHEGANLPGKFVPSHRIAYVAWGGKEVSKHIYEVSNLARGIYFKVTKDSNGY